MNTLDTLALAGLGLATLTAGLFLLNWRAYRRLPSLVPTADRADRVSVLIPARNEENHIGAAVRSVLANVGVELEVIVLDDHSTDRTAEIVRELSALDARVRLLPGSKLPVGWCGKQHACHQLAGGARHPWLVFLDADVRLAPDALMRMLGFLKASGAALASGLPRQVVQSWSEKLLIPLIHFILLGFLPIHLMRSTRWPAFSAGCGQLFIARAIEYAKVGGHRAIRATLHDGLKLPRLFRRAGLKTELFDADDVATCRMYQNNSETWRGLSKNAIEGLAAPGLIVPMTLLLVGGQVLPFLLLMCLPSLSPVAEWATLSAVGLALLPRLIAAVRFGQPLVSALAHPIGIVGLVAIQWYALGRHLFGAPQQWKGRSYAPTVPHRQTAARFGAWTLSTALLWAPLAGHAAAPAPEKGAQVFVCPGLDLEDQFRHRHQVVFPTTNQVLLTFADQNGAAEVDSWISALKPRCSGRVPIIGVADVSPVPAMLRSFVRSRFREKYSRPVLLDWNGRLRQALPFRSGRANIYLLDTAGKVLAWQFGPAEELKLSRILDAMPPGAS